MSREEPILPAPEKGIRPEHRPLYDAYVAFLEGAAAAGLTEARGLTPREHLDILARLVENEIHSFAEVMLPDGSCRDLRDDRATRPEAMGAYQILDRTLRDAEVLEFAARYRRFLRRLRPAGIRVHALEDDADRDGIVARLLLAEVF